MNKQLIIVPDYVSADDANRLYGDSFGVDWVYEGRDSKPLPEIFPGTSKQLSSLSIRLPDEDTQWCNPRGMRHSVELKDADCESPDAPTGESHD